MTTLKERFVKVRNEYSVLKATHETLKEIEKEAETKILKDHVFMTDMTYRKEFGEPEERITDPFNTFEMTDEDFQKYLDLRYEALKDYLPNRDTTIDYQTFKPLLRLEDELVRIGYQLVNRDSNENITDQEIEKICNSIKYRKKILDLIMTIDATTIK